MIYVLFHGQVSYVLDHTYTYILLYLFIHMYDYALWYMQTATRAAST